jgi:hypothetical protein
MEDVENRTFTQLENGKLHVYDIITGDLIEARELNAVIHTRPYTFELGQMISGKVREGMTITAITRELTGITAGMVYRWRTQHPDFSHALKEARLDRAHHFHDRIIDEINECDNLQKEDVPAKKLKIDTLKWAAEKNNPKEYGAKTTISGDADNPIGLTVISTGIQRAAPQIAEAVEAEFTEVSDD